MGPFWTALAVAFAGGVALAVQSPINSALGRALNDTILATIISFGGGLVVLALVMFARGSLPNAAVFRSVQPWMISGGALGAFYVWSALWSVPRLGVLTMIAALILGQLLASLMVDQFGLFGIPVREIAWQRIVAVVLVGAGVVFSRF